MGISEHGNFQKTLESAAGSAVELPIVSVIVVNFNYGRFLRQAVDSIFQQTYPNIECIVVDNASTDESPDVLAEIETVFPAVKIIRRASNDGQTPASLDGFGAASGQYIIFLDADDYLLPQCVETHIYVHLSVRPHIGFTSGDMLQLSETRVVVASGEELNRFLRRWGRKPARLRPFKTIAGWPSSTVAAELETKVHYVAPLRTHWVWSPTSGLCYRRDALLLFADNARLRTLRTGTDIYFAMGCSGLSGSALIDEPLFAYRTHGGNIYTSRPQLDRTLNYTIGGHGDSNTQAQLFLIDHLVERASRFTPNFPLRLHLLALLLRLDRRDEHTSPGARLPGWARRSRAAQAIAQNYAGFSTAVGGGLARIMLAWCAKSLRAPKSLAGSLRSKAI